MTPQKRPILKYYGGKWRIATWIIGHFPVHRVYIEPFAGAASVLLRKPASKIEVLNDINKRIISAFSVLRDPQQSARLCYLLRTTPYSSEDYKIAREISSDPIEDARRLIILGHQSHGSTGPSGGKQTGWRRRNDKTRTANGATSWARIYEFVPWWCDRLRAVHLERDDAVAVMRRWDAPDSLIYADPPYVKSTRGSDYKNRAYAADMSDDDHIRLAEFLHCVRGAVVISGYDCELYRKLYGDWRRFDHRAFADRGKKTTESIWLNRKAEEGKPSGTPGRKKGE